VVFLRLSQECVRACGRLRTTGTSLPTVCDAQSGNVMLLKSITKRLVRYTIRNIGASSYSDYLLRTSQEWSESVFSVAGAEQRTHPETEPQPVLLGKLLVP
jgi:hypothetical protein